MFKRFSPTSVGRWSTERPWLAISVWLAFVVAAVFALSLTGSKQLQNGAVGQSAHGYALMDSHRLGLNPHQYAYLHSDSLTAGAPSFHAAIDAIATRMRAALHGHVQVVIARNRHAALVAGEITGPFSSAALQRSVDAVRAAHPLIQSVLGTTGGDGASNDLSRAEQLSVPVTLLVLLIAFGALVAALVPVLLAATAVIAAFRTVRADQPAVPARRQRQDGRAADRDGRRRRLRPVLRRALARGAAPRPLHPRGARPDGPHVRAHGADRGHHGGDRDGRAVRDRV